MEKWRLIKLFIMKKISSLIYNFNTEKKNVKVEINYRISDVNLFAYH